jgi:hypothetical protein
MALTQEERNNLAETFVMCETALADKPTLKKIFGKTWRVEFHKQILAADSLMNVAFPEAYYAPCLIDVPSDYQQRIEEGATIMLTILKGWARNEFFSRLQQRDSTSATEELLLARGFFNQFGRIEWQIGNRAARRAEFTVFIQGHTIAIEARGLRNSKVIQELNENSWRSGQRFWLSTDPDIGKSKRVRKALAEKMLESTDNIPRIIVLSLYSAFDVPNGISVASQMALEPQSFDIPQTKFPLAVVLVSSRRLQGLWFNRSIVERLCFSRNTQDEIVAAIKNSFYPREDGVFLHG